MKRNINYLIGFNFKYNNSVRVTLTSHHKLLIFLIIILKFMPQ